MKYINIAVKCFSVLCLVALVGCANKGSTTLKDLSESEVNTKITVGKTNRDDVRLLFGSPLETTYTDGGLEIWKYTYEDVSGWNATNVASGVLTLGLAGSVVKGMQKELIVLFDDNYKVKRYNMSSSPVTRGTGLF